MPRVAVIIATKDRPSTLTRALESLAQQTNPGLFGIIIVNDSTDQSKEFTICRPDFISWDRIKIIDLGHQGLSASRNLALSILWDDTEFVTYLDDDDVVLPEHIETLVRAMDAGAKVAYTDSLLAIEDINLNVKSRKPYVSNDYSREELLQRNLTPICNVMHVRDDLRFDTEMPVLEDWDFLIRLSEKYDFVHVPTITAEVHWRENKQDNMTHTHATLFKEYEQRIIEREREKSTRAVHICLITPQDNLRGSECFREVAEALRETARIKGYLSDIITNMLPSTGTNIVLGWHLLATNQFPSNCIIYNLENLAEWDKYHSSNTTLIERLRIISGSCRIWDFSRQNVDQLLEVAGVPVTHVPIGYSPCLTRIKSLPPEEQDIDVLFYGSVNDRRKNIIQEMLKAGINVTWVTDKYGKERDDLIARAKIILNLHFYEDSILEMPRIMFATANSKCMVSEINETNEDDDGTPALGWGVTAGGLIGSCKYYLSAPKTRKSFGDSLFQWALGHPQRLPVEENMVAQEKPTVCLSMIVKADQFSSESHVITRCLDTCKDVITLGRIFLTAEIKSTFNANLGTLISQWFIKKGLNFDLDHLLWEGHYAEARNTALEQAQKTTAQWIQLIDADEELDAQPEEVLRMLITTPYDSVVMPVVVQDKDGHQRVFNRIAFVRNIAGWGYIGRYHEDLQFNGTIPESDYLGGSPDDYTQGPHIFTASDGATHKDPERDSKIHRLLFKAFTESGDPRDWFFYAEQTRICGKYDEAVIHFTSFLEMAKEGRGKRYPSITPSMVYYALLTLGRLFIHKGQVAEGRVKFIEAYSLMPSRVEALGEMALVHASRGEWAMARIYALACANSPRPRAVDFLEPEWAQWRGLDILTVALQNLGQVDNLPKYYQLLLGRKALPASERTRVETNFNNLMNGGK